MNTEILRRRTFAIISHPDAGKTTLTEKFLLYGGAIQLAGSVTARKEQRETTSDWMELEKKRGISISSTVLQFDYGNWKLNLLDTPGHRDFSEDTYRVLMAVDAAIMIIDAGKGIESQTKKLFQICRQRGIPIITFMNKLDRPSKSALELIDELESTLGIDAYPVNWPLGNGTSFKGVYDRLQKQVHLYEKVSGGAYKAPVSIHSLLDSIVAEVMDKEAYGQILEELDILENAHVAFDSDRVLAGKTTPILFGSASNNFGVQPLLDFFVRYSPPPVPRNSNRGLISVESPDFSGFVFKVQTNMNPLHRDRVAFLRVCSGKFERDMTAYHTRTGKKIRLSDPHLHLGQSREIIDEAYPGDIIGFVAKPELQIGDTVSEDGSIEFHEIPRFAPEFFAFLNNPKPAQYKPFRRGLNHLLSENIVQAFRLIEPEKSNRPLLGAVGPLQFEVLQYRLENEYGASSILESQPWKLFRWVHSTLDDESLKRILPYECAIAQDESDRRVILFNNEWSMERFLKEHSEKAVLSTFPNGAASKAQTSSPIK